METGILYFPRASNSQKGQFHFCSGVLNACAETALALGIISSTPNSHKRQDQMCLPFYERRVIVSTKLETYQVYMVRK